MKFVVDMNLSPDWVAELAVHGHAAVHWQELGPGDAPDGAIIERAARMASAILTADLDFGEVVTLLGLSGPSIVQLRTDSTNPARIGHLVAEAIAQAEADLEAGAVLTIELHRTRVRRYPSASPELDS